ncbi:TPA: isoprenylcysteine carboxylmethyltransferase family protein [Pasteurella multocida]|uniref:methyltransferase family protein n=1 Tax=Pasteurella multocida TaxID=747 RepID=UPI00145AEE67|nr:isoprenylcysteine carboxylmethyltransferase family protein [Pasteurella multocida]NMK16311.1 isoprenylcysteine carboxylmethyltransferase family protein [Pasteurella multocida]URH77065.1 isoprenylcysteine carboxylmethyltransferase family protein [Pasteurella multocida]URH79197.1 isoprenylcysteine carboxylmethyltransferase family protein [Pasteurella multocida]URH90998.1 isoprenylcysteine carboxylmethyltransferase family protein [Pasteurella multocida]URJ86123.1 isoprenylcysteine carboxylmeth
MTIRLPPPVIFLACAAVMWCLPPIYQFARHTWLVGLFILMSGIIGSGSLWQFWQAKTTVDPIRLEKSSALVVSGIYQFSRNPMYLSLALLLLAWGLWLASLSAVLFLVVFVFCITQFQIKPEERQLEKLFGDAYLDYKQKVRRWL